MRTISQRALRRAGAGRKRLCLRLACGLALLIYSALACASGPRYVTGPPYFTGPAGVAVVWSTMTPLYYTDPGDLSASVNHQAADALVAAAAAVWNVPVAKITLAQGGSLNEDVSGANVYLGGTGMVYPDDVASTNFAAVPIAVIYDADGAVTDTLLGGGASDPSSCLQNAVTESVDRFDPAGYIQHAVLVLNGLCTGPAPEQQQQMQYQLMRAFGRVLGLAWSQTNDNVFTGTPASTYQQAQNWPILHPIDILCSSYSYQCLPQPFTLRPDDISGLVTLYPVVSPAPPGKQVSLALANGASGVLEFPTGQGMAGVNVVLTRMNSNVPVPEAWQTATAVTGAYFRRVQATPITAQGTSVDDSAGGFDQTTEGSYLMGYLPVVAGDLGDTEVTSSEPVNPLYTGSYAVGPYVSGAVVPSGSPIANNTIVNNRNTDKLTMVVSDASSQCGTGEDGTLSAPAPADASGWWSGLLCGYGHFAWTSLNVQPGRSFTMEVTALDEQGNATSAKAMPVIGAWAASDPLTSLPTLGSAATPFNGQVNGMTTLTVASGTASSIRLVVADQRGDGRPDYAYQARIFYAESLAPATVSTAGGDTLSITGMGFRAGNIVQVNGVQATAISASSNSLVVAVPPSAAAFARNGTPVDVTVSDLTTGATSTLPAALTYSDVATQPNVMKLLTAQVGNAFSGQSTSVPFAVQILKPDGVTPVVSEPVTFSGSVAGQASALECGACGKATCVVMSDASGVASTAVTPLATGAVTLQATDKTVTLQSTFTAIAPSGSVQVVSAPSGSVYVGKTAASAFTVRLLATDGKTPLAGRPITFSTTTGAVNFNVCSASTCVVTTDANGLALTGVTPSAAGPVTLLATDGLVSQAAAFTALDNTPVLKILLFPTTTAFTQSSAGGFTIGLYQADGVTPMPQQTVVITATATSGGGPQGIIYSQCSANPCITTTNSQGQVGGLLSLLLAGTYTIQVAYGSIVQSFVETVLPKNPILRLISAPTGNQQIGQVAPTLFKVQSLQYDGVTPFITAVTLSAALGQVSFGACAFPSCYLTPDSNGYVSTTVTPLVPGPISIQAENQQLVVTAEINGISSSDILQLVSAPTGTVFSGQVAATPFAVRVIGAGQTTPTPGKIVTFSVASGLGTFSACSLSTCTLVTDSTGTASSLFTPLSTGTVSLQAADGTVAQRASFTVSSSQDVLRLVSAPNGSVYVGDVTAVPFAARLLLYDGVTPDAGKSVTLSVTRGSATLGCGAASCALTSDAGGNVSTTITPLTAGTVTLLASSGSLTQTASFTAVAQPDIIRLVSAPSGLNYSGVLSAAPFTVQVMAGDGVTPAAGRSVTFSITNGSGVFSACGQPTCTLVTNAAGTVSSFITPTSTGTVSLLAADGAVTQSTSFTVASAPDVLNLVSAPSGSVYVGEVAAVPFAARLFLYGGVTPDAGKSVTISVTNGSAVLGSCAASSCTMTTDADGSVSLTVKPLAAGTITLLASSGGLTQTASFIAVEKPESLQLVSVPSGESYVGTAFATPFAVQALAGDGVTPVVGSIVTFTVTNGSARLSACPASSCGVVSDANGIASVSITPLAAGAIVLQAADGAAVQTVTLTGIADTEAVIASAPQLFVAEGAVVPWTLAATAVLNGSPGADIPVSWTGTSGLSVSSALSLTNDTGLGTMSAIAGPLAAGVSASAQACSWETVCASFQAVSVPASEWRVVIMSGAGQVVSGGGALQPVVARVVDGAGHSIAGAPVTIRETVTEQTMPCPVQGRCPAAPVLASKTLSAVTDVSGQVTITPLTVDGAPTATNVAVSAGTQGFATVVLLRSP